jgi:hypothetical protein
MNYLQWQLIVHNYQDWIKHGMMKLAMGREEIILVIGSAGL